ncbi:branched-chain amino acid ABC transporter permease [Bradyrhizobium sp. LHD-71]|uniref:branched-chain amino acid ABC transporter permease n=1 Tax=Bradyrhizobium sp. LHD-71 TaxID=3072141 RepID=UPI00280DA18F|nr:branched-chain amino acid ABC transporter permease [Bradyrhizobium sp. LHD-71]MDQ8727354.1 branched-chain amino acid ABC transporter permease [Bradyrhizobium sp. LHD-71]
MFDATIVLQILWTSLATATYYVLFATAFALVLKVTRLFNFAQAAIMTIAFYTAFVGVQWLKWPGWAAFVLMMVVTLAASYALERIGFEALRRRGVSVMFVFVFTFIVSEFIAYLAMLIFGTWPQTVFPMIFWPVTLVGNIAISAWDLPAIGSTVAAIAALFAFMRFTRLGQFMVGVADNPDLAELYGINRRLVFLLAMLIAGALVALGMFLYGTRAQVLPQTALSLMLFAVAATIIGGIGNLGGAVAAAVILGVIQNASILVIPSEWQGFLLYVFLFLAIVFFPNGLRLPRRRERFGSATRKIAGEEASTPESRG